MRQTDVYQSTIEKLYALYLEKGFLEEEEALGLMSADGVSLVGINRVTDKLIALGVIFADAVVDDDEYTDRAQIDYGALFDEVLAISPGQKMLIAYARNVKPPQTREWRSLVTQMESGNEYAFSRLFDMYLRNAIKTALRCYKSYGLDLDDAIQEGCIGLMYAIMQFDGSRHNNIGSNLSRWIQLYIVREAIDKNHSIRLPVRVYELTQKVKQCKRMLLKQNRYEPTLTEISLMSEISIEMVMKLLEIPQDPVLFDSMFETAKSRTEVEKHCSNQFFGEELESNILALQVRNALFTLPERERRVLSLRYGLADEKEWTLEEVSAVFDITRERVRQIEKGALSKLCTYAREQHMESAMIWEINTSLS